VSPRLRSAKRRFVLTMNLLGAIGACLTLVCAVSWGVTWIDLAIFVSMYVTAGLGVSVGFHRYFAHRSFVTGTAGRTLLAVMGSLAGVGPVITWVATHRCHHQYSDKAGDPHSPRVHARERLSLWRGIYHAHIGWLLNAELPSSFRYARDLLSDRVVGKVNRMYGPLVMVGLVLPAVLGGILSCSWQGALTGFLWGGPTRLFLNFHAACCINSLTHRFGQRRFQSRECSTNSLLLVLPTLGEAWHNNHHAFPSSARFGLSLWQVDPGYIFLQLLSWVGLVSKLKQPTAAQIAARVAARAPVAQARRPVG
jgi:stearoyl-CoA desaturase (Delta-9 desaturase)